MNKQELVVHGPSPTLGEDAGWITAGVASLQHLTLAAVLLSSPILIAHAAGSDVQTTVAFVGMSLLAMAIGAIVQSIGIGRRIGSRRVCFPFPSIIYLPALLSAATKGGLDLVFGMTAFAGVVTLVIAPLMQRVRSLFPTEIAGLVVLLSGVSSGLLGMQFIGGQGYSAHAPVGAGPLVAGAGVAVLALTVMAALHVWGGRGLSLSSVAIGTLVGSLMASLAGSFEPSGTDIPALSVRFPLVPMGWRFDADLALPFAISALANALKTSGTVMVLQKELAPDRERADLANISAGIAADGLTVLFCGLAGATPLAASSGSAGLAIATRMHSRKVAWCFAVLCLMCGLLPLLAHLVILLPRPVLGAALVFSAAFMLANGLKILSSRPLDSRRTLVVGLGLILGLSSSGLDELIQQVPASLQAALGSPLVLGTSTSLLVNLIFRLGVTRRGRFVFERGMHDASKAGQLIDELGRLWGARDRVVERARFGVAQAVEILRHDAQVEGKIVCAVSFDDYNVHIKLQWKGPTLPWPDEMPTTTAILDHPQGSTALAAYMLRQIADRATLHSRGDQHVMRLGFEH